MPTKTLNTGALIPAIGFGTWELTGDKGEAAIREALAAGYRHIDTAKYYKNEERVGAAVRQSGISREQLFITTKLWPTDFLDPRAAFETSLKNLGLEYVDLYLIHWPIPGQPKSVWRALERIYEEKLAHAIGVSNFGLADLEKLFGYANVPPAANQVLFNPFNKSHIWFDPFQYEKGVLEFCNEHNIVVEAYSPLTRGKDIQNETLGDIAKKYKKTPAQILIRWCIEHGTIPLPKSSHPERMRENLDVFNFSLEKEDIQALDTLSN